MVAPDRTEVGEAGGRVQPAKPFTGLLFNTAKFPTAESLVNCPGFRAAERPYRTDQTYYARRTGSTSRMRHEQDELGELVAFEDAGRGGGRRRGAIGPAVEKEIDFVSRGGSFHRVG